MLRVRGFKASAVHAGIKESGKLDMGLIVADRPAAAAAVFTRNVVKAAPVVVGRRRLRRGLCRAVIVNSGNANACTGRDGMEDARRVTSAVARELSVPESLVVPASTGVIGVRLPVDRMRAAVPRLVAALDEGGLHEFAEAIMTTDTFPKHVVRDARIGGVRGRVCVVAKGAGMIAPHMATMLAFVLTEFDVTPAALSWALRRAVDETYNRIIVDGDTSTNDTVLALAGGAAGNRPIDEGSAELEALTELLTELNHEAARMIVRDGEGATKVVRIVVRGAPTRRAAERVARTLGTSLLVKTALYGEDPNWGRFAAAAGRAGVRFDPARLDLYFDQHLVLKGGVPVADEDKLVPVFKKPEFTVTLDLGVGSGEWWVLASDISEEYVRLNAEYRT